jgi:hypothetical protein
MAEWFNAASDRYPNEPVEFEPGATSHFHVCIKTAFKGFIWVAATLVDSTDTTWVADRLVLVE